MRMAGDVGQLWVGYHKSVTLGSWSITRHQDTLGDPVTTLTGIVQDCDDFWSQHQPTRLTVWMGGAWWVWATIEVQGAVERGKPLTLGIKGSPTAQVPGVHFAGGTDVKK